LVVATCRDKKHSVVKKKKVRLISKKEEDKDVMPSVLSVVLTTHELFVSRKPSVKPNLLVWEIIESKSTLGAVKFFECSN